MDFEYFAKNFPEGGDQEYVLSTIGDMQDLMAVGLKLCLFIIRALGMDHRVSKYGTNGFFFFFF